MKGNIIFKMKSFLKMQFFNFHDVFPLFFGTNNLRLFHVTKRKKKSFTGSFFSASLLSLLYKAL